MTIYFVSGHLDITQEEFDEYYATRLTLCNVPGFTEFVVGDANGCDLMAQQFLKWLDAKVTVYHMFDAPRNNVGFETKGGFVSDKLRDEAMTNASDSDIAWVRPGREKSGTAKNLKRRDERDERDERDKRKATG